MPDVPAHRDRRLSHLYRFVECGVGLAKAVCEEHLPGGQLRIPQQNPPELDEVSVDGAFAAPRRANELFQLEKSLFGALYINAAVFGFALTKLAETGYVAWIDWRCVVRSSEAV